MEIIKHGWAKDLVCSWCESELRVTLLDLRNLLQEELYVFKCLACGMKSHVPSELLPVNISKFVLNISVEYGTNYPTCRERVTEPTLIPTL